jgi:hypothetical protein
MHTQEVDCKDRQSTVTDSQGIYHLRLDDNLTGIMLKSDFLRAHQPSSGSLRDRISTIGIQNNAIGSDAWLHLLCKYAYIESNLALIPN